MARSSSPARAWPPAGRQFHLGYSPERIDPGSTTWTFERTPKVVSGIDAASLTKVQGFYRLHALHARSWRGRPLPAR